MELKEMLEELVRLFLEGEVVEKIVAAENHLEEYQKQKEIYKEELKKFSELTEYEEIDKEYKVLPKDSLQICMICMMSYVDDFNLFNDFTVLTNALLKIKKKEFRVIALKMYHFMVEELDCFSFYEEEKLIEMFFSN